MPVDEHEPPPEQDTPEPGEWEETSVAEEWRKLALVFGYLSAGGFMMVAATGIGFLAGRWIDGKAGSDPAFATILAFTGFAAGVFQLWRFVQLLQQRQGRDARPRARK